MAYSSKDMAREAGMTTEGLRFYEKSGIIKVKKNAKNGYRVYEVMQVPFLRMAKILNTYGIPLHDIRRFSTKATKLWAGFWPPWSKSRKTCGWNCGARAAF